MIRVTFLGTAAARPTVGRNVTSLAVQREGDIFLFDCGEGTQRQMMRYQSGFELSAIFITHLHADHILGLPGLLRTLALQGRVEPLRIYGPPRSRQTLEEVMRLGSERLPFRLPIQELSAGDKVRFSDYVIQAVPVEHGLPAVGYALIEDLRLGRFDVERARQMGIPEGPLFGQLHQGESVEFEGRTVTPEELVGPPRAGRKLVFTGDTRPTDALCAVAAGADLLIHEATFLEEEGDRALETNHSTARGAAELAAKAGCKALLLTHISARYADDPGRLRDEACEFFPGARVAHDGLVFEIPFPEEE